MSVEHVPENDLLALLRRQIDADSRFLVAYSGGLDSCVLLHLMMRLQQQLPIEVRAAYVHHGLNPRADAWADHCRRQCQLWRIPFEVLTVHVDARRGGIEASAREARYAALRTSLQPQETLLTAQHQDDQSETFLLALKRGSGPAGLASMAAFSAGRAFRQRRPLLNMSREQLACYANTHQLSWIEDDSNSDERFDRNFLRLRILPLLKQRWPHFPSAVARSAELCAEQEQLLDELLAEALAGMCNPQGGLAIDALRPLSPVRRFALLRRWLASRGAKMPARDQLSRLWLEVACCREDAEPSLLLGRWQVRRFRGDLYLLPVMNSVKACVLPWQPEIGALPLPDGLGELRLSSEKTGACIRRPQRHETVTVRFSASGDVHIVGRQHGRHLKKLWQELGVPPWLRDRTPMIFYNDVLIAALGRFVTQTGQPASESDGWYVDWHLPGDGDE
ncbi:tRNA lysidine(34) synthetase TilS [Musicola keenii]|uniref:tRNA lysidine(34) synthetase TilS n=1 Tax=Musicola keenii TaxID=2884250 RepID=UPI001782BAA2|nr:tRNA lysidine(34) synthetase TilS [Musicola keenii]